MTDDEQAPPQQPQVQIFVPPANLLPPKALVFDDNLAKTGKAGKERWKARSRYEIATGVAMQDEIIRVSTLLSVIGEDSTKAYETFTWEPPEDKDNIADVIKTFDDHCEPWTQVIYERYRFNNKNKLPGENISAYLTELRTRFNHASTNTTEQACSGNPWCQSSWATLPYKWSDSPASSRHNQSGWTNTTGSEIDDNRGKWQRQRSETPTARPSTKERSRTTQEKGTGLKQQTTRFYPGSWFRLRQLRS